MTVLPVIRDGDRRRTMKDVSISVPVNDQTLMDDIARVDAVAAQIAAALDLEMTYTGVGFGQRDVRFEAPEEADLGALRAGAEAILWREGLTGAMISVYEVENMTIPAKWCMDDARTLAEAAQQLRAYADELEELAREGWELLEQPVQDDYGYLVRSAIKS
jgi:hypothetical protein